MNLNTLQPNAGATKREKRIGRGTASGQGCTSGKGMNGAKARSGYNTKLYFEGGQLPLIRRLPKVGFNNAFKVYSQIVNIRDLEKLSVEGDIDGKVLHEAGLIHSEKKPIKVLGEGELTKTLTVKAHSFSKSAIAKIEKAGGKAEVITCA